MERLYSLLRLRGHCCTRNEKRALIASKEGLLYVKGGNECYSLGVLPPEVDDWTLVPLSFKVKKAYTGKFHSFLITEEGALYCTGKNYYGQLGLESSKLYKTWTYCPIPFNVIGMAIWSQFSFLITEKGLVCGTGYSRFGYRDRNNHSKVCQFRKNWALLSFPFPVKLIKVIAPLDHALLITEQGLQYQTLERGEWHRQN